MYKLLSIDGRAYRLEYTIEAALYTDCTQKLMDFWGKTFAVLTEEDLTKGMSNKGKNEARLKLLQESFSGILNLPETAITVFYTGLLEYHGPSGDNTVQSLTDAKILIKEYFKEHSDDGTDNFYDLLSICMEQMEEDGFFKRTGLEKFMTLLQKQEETPKPNRATRRAIAKVSET